MKMCIGFPLFTCYSLSQKFNVLVMPLMSNQFDSQNHLKTSNYFSLDDFESQTD